MIFIHFLYCCIKVVVTGAQFSQLLTLCPVLAADIRHIGIYDAFGLGYFF